MKKYYYLKITYGQNRNPTICKFENAKDILREQKTILKWGINIASCRVIPEKQAIYEIENNISEFDE